MNERRTIKRVKARWRSGGRGSLKSFVRRLIEDSDQDADVCRAWLARK